MIFFGKFALTLIELDVIINVRFVLFVAFVTLTDTLQILSKRNLKVSFEYPDNWFVEPTGGMGEDITLQNIDPGKVGMTKGIVVVTPDHFNIEIGYNPGALEGYSSFEEWVDIVEQRVPAENRISRVNLENVDGHHAIQLVSAGVTDPNILFGEILIEKNKDVYFIRVIPANTEYTEILAHVSSPCISHSIWRAIYV